jgi:hypothetical protein
MCNDRAPHNTVCICRHSCSVHLQVEGSIPAELVGTYMRNGPGMQVGVLNQKHTPTCWLLPGLGGSWGVMDVF